MAMDTAKLQLIEQRVANDGKNMVVAYLLWFFLGFFSAHRFYLGQTGSAIFQFILNILIIGLIWTFIDVFLIPGMVNKHRETLRQRLTAEMAAMP
jgi:TM2 domain-containing membrane protein YozV